MLFLIIMIKITKEKYDFLSSGPQKPSKNIMFLIVFSHESHQVRSLSPKGVGHAGERGGGLQGERMRRTSRGGGLEPSSKSPSPKRGRRGGEGGLLLMRAHITGEDLRKC